MKMEVSFVCSAAKNSGISSIWFKLSSGRGMSAKYIPTGPGQARTSLKSPKLE